MAVLVPPGRTCRTMMEEGDEEETWRRGSTGEDRERDKLRRARGEEDIKRSRREKERQRERRSEGRGEGPRFDVLL